MLIETPGGGRRAFYVVLAGVAISAVAAVWTLAHREPPEAKLRDLLASHSTGVIHLPPGVIEISGEIELPRGAHDLTILGPGTTLIASNRFHGRAILSGEAVRNVRLVGFAVDGNRAALAAPQEAAPPENRFREYYRNNGILFDRADSIELSGLRLVHIPNFAVLISRSHGIRISSLTIEDSGSLNSQGRNNTTGGIAIEEGSSDFEVRGCTLTRVRGNGIWTHSLYRSPRLSNGLFEQNHLDTIGRDAIQVGHATGVRVKDNTGLNIGFPNEIVDWEHSGTPVGVDTAGNVDGSIYSGNTFQEVNGKCFDLDGFHDGSVTGNLCTNSKSPAAYPYGHFGIVLNNSNPDMKSQNIEISNNRIIGMKFGGLFLIGSGHRVTGNSFENLDEAGCNETKAVNCIYNADEPQLLEAGIYLGRRAERPADTRDNIIRGNRITGHKMSVRCVIFGPGVSRKSNLVEDNRCSDEASR